MKQTGTKKRLLAAQLVAEDILTDEQIAAKIGIGRTTLHRWKLDEKFKARVKKIGDEFAERASKNGLARKEVRVSELIDLYLKAKQIIDERGESSEMKDIPGGTTGLIVKNYKQIGKDAKELFEVDTGLMKQMAALQDQIAIELGQRVSKLEVNSATFNEMTDEELERYATTGALPERVKPGAASPVM